MLKAAYTSVLILMLKAAYNSVLIVMLKAAYTSCGSYSRHQPYVCVLILMQGTCVLILL